MSLVLIGILVAGNDDAKKAAEKDLAAMQGEWHLRWLELNGVKKSEFGQDVLYTIRGNRVYFEGKPHRSLKIDPTCTPKLLDVTKIREDAPAEERGQSYEGIYKIEGDTLIWCWSYKEGVRERPQTFDASKGTRVYLESFTRVKR